MGLTAFNKYRKNLNKKEGEAKTPSNSSKNTKEKGKNDTKSKNTRA